MNFTIPQKDLSAALARCAAIAPDKSSLPVLSNVKLSPWGEMLLLSATDLEVGYSIGLGGLIWNEETDSPVPFLLPAKKLHEIVKAIPIGEVTFVVSNNTATISGGTVTFVLAGLEADDFPLIEQAASEGLQFIPWQLAQAIKPVAYCQCSDETRYNLHGCFLRLEANVDAELFAEAVATDGHRLCINTDCIAENEKDPLGPCGPISAELGKGVIVPVKGVAELLKLTAKTPGLISLDGNNLTVSMGDETISIRLVDGDFPDYTRVVPPNPIHFISLKRQGMIDALERVRIITDKNNRRITLQVEGDSLSVSSALTSIGAEASDRVSIEVVGEPPVMYMSVEYLLQALDNISSSQVQLRITDSNSPVIVIPAGSDGLSAIIMPMQ